ncbi:MULTISPECIES: RnfH family protein [unclassified Lonepinella]|uniref:RnfH family protein n=1 Tax=unclassified Lonepinella TaxID=2642006 RepID=UPI0036DE8A40
MTETEKNTETNIEIEIAYAYPTSYFLKKLQVKQGTTVQAAILQSGILQQYTDIDLRENKVGIFSRPVKLTDPVNNGDRIEIYRPLLADPKEIRRKRAEEQAKEAAEKKKSEKEQHKKAH